MCGDDGTREATREPMRCDGCMRYDEDHVLQGGRISHHREEILQRFSRKRAHRVDFARARAATIAVGSASGRTRR